MKEVFNLYNTLTRQVEPIRPLQADRLTVYTCGPTVYGDAHIGNFRTFIYEDTLVKALRYFGYRVKWVMNITDVGHLTSDRDEGEDKLEVGARREGTTAWAVAKKYEQSFLADSAALRMAKPDRLVRATDCIEQQITLVQELEAKGYTYCISDGIYFDTSKFPTYGQMARLDIAGLQAGARVAMQEEKKHPTDFALWKFSPTDRTRDMEWSSPWGTGFPGWHLECSAIAMSTLGKQIDIHCGGTDHIPVHHTNEIAQSEAATGKQFARHWMHTDHLLVNGGKMSKSLGNLYTLADVTARGFDPLALRLLYYGASYRSKQNFTWHSLETNQKLLDRLRQQAAELPETGEDTGNAAAPLAAFRAALANDLNMPAAVAALIETMKSPLDPAAKRAFVTEVERVLSLGLLQEPEKATAIPDKIRQLAAAREERRREGKWDEADAIRRNIEAAGYELRDAVGGGKSQIRKKAQSK
ncbi:cysteine--tRNA ligase [Patescibacteria group bacterium]|nr:cysteine--tRNA ligase [Patescibacteria group bacterium]